MYPVAVCGLDDHEVPVENWLRIDHDRIIVPAEIAGEEECLPLNLELGRRRAKDVPRSPEEKLHTIAEIVRIVEFNGSELPKCAFCIFNPIQRQGRPVAAEAMPVGEL